jgi:two-component system, chemotaxis family, sensor kinase Cph1
VDTTNTAAIIKKNEAEVCGRVPLHQTNQIQPHGAVLVVKTDDLTILQASENSESFTGVPVEKLVETSLGQYISSSQLIALQVRLKSAAMDKVPLVLTINNVDVLALFQPQQPYVIIELESLQKSADQDSFVDIYQEVKYVMAELDGAKTTVETCAIVTKELKRISGFDKIMIYRFDEDWNGEVIAEEMEEGMEAYLGLKFPASDVPKQARELYRKTPYRLIPNVNYQPEKLYPVINPITHAFTDLTNCNLRSVAGVHLEYLRNMQVAASMSTRILKDGQLWGLIACHHRTPKYLPYQVCSLFEMLSSVVTNKIMAVQYHDAYHSKSDLQLKLSGIIESVYRKNDLISGLISQQTELLELLNADGFAISNKKHTESFGETPSRVEVEELIYWLQSNNVTKLYQQPQLSRVFDGADIYAKTSSGLLALPIQPEKGYYMLAFRAEAVQKINWGGNPNEAVQFEKDQKNYHPRNSFKLWQETVYNKSIPWNEEQLIVAERLRNFVVEYLLNAV